MPWDDPQPGEVDQVHAESRDDLEKLLPVAQKLVTEYGPVRGAVELTTGLLMQPSWTRMELASVVGVALVRLVQPQPTTDTP